MCGLLLSRLCHIQSHHVGWWCDWFFYLHLICHSALKSMPVGPDTLAPALITVCHGWPATAGYRASSGGCQASDQHQWIEALLPGDGQRRSRPDGMGEKALLVPCTLTQSGWSTNDRTSGSAGCKMQSAADHMTARVCVWINVTHNFTFVSVLTNVPQSLSWIV